MDTLSDKHRQTLEVESGISPDVIESRGYRTVSVKADLRRSGFKDYQCRVPTLLMPVWNPTGEIALYQSRPDEPRISNGKAIKYETLAGSAMSLDCHPSVRHMLGNPEIPLWGTEGIKKGDALVSHGCCAISLLGVWNWRGTNKEGGKTALPDWELIALNGRIVYICFDSDVMLKPEVHAALVRLKNFLELRKAKVRLIYLPSGESGAKVGVDDYLASGKNIDDLLALASTELRKPESDNSEKQETPEGSDADRAISYVKASGAEMFHDQHGEAFIAFENEQKRREVWPLKSKAASELIRWKFFKEEEKGLTGEALATARGALAALARFKGPGSVINSV